MPLLASGINADPVFIAVCRTLLANGFRSYRCHCHSYCFHCCNLCPLKGCERFGCPPGRQAGSMLSIYFHFPYQTPFSVIVAAAAVTYAPWMNAHRPRQGPQSVPVPEGCPRSVGCVYVCVCFTRGFGARDFHTNVIKSSTTLKLNTSHGANGVMIFYVELDADNGTIAALTPLPTSPLTRPPARPLPSVRPHLRLQPPCCLPGSVCSLGGFVFVCVVIEINPSIEVEFNLAQNGKRVCVRPALISPSHLAWPAWRAAHLAAAEFVQLKMISLLTLKGHCQIVSY